MKLFKTIDSLNKCLHQAVNEDFKPLVAEGDNSYFQN